ncbi:MAG: hypothetical protein GC129_06015 [Proteobacteria bacterium]|nr:hypothetical protein [Pseudomonadota bacterium]
MAIKSLRRKASRVADKSIDAAQEGLETARSKKDQLNAKYGPRADAMEAKLADYAEDLGRKVRESYESGVEKFEEGTETAREVVSRNPLMAVAGAFLGGLVVSSLFRR